jgi:hypothetical protein
MAEILVPGRLTGSRDGDASPTPFLPTFLAEINGDDTRGAAYVKLGATLGYIAAATRLTIFDQATLAIVGQTAPDVTNMNGNHHCELNDDETVAFSINEQANRISSIDISNKAAPVALQHFSGPNAPNSLAGAGWCARDGNLLFVCCYTRDSVAIIDVTDPANMVWVAEFRGTTGGTSLNQCRRIALDRVNKICYYACDATGTNMHRFGAFSYANTGALAGLWFIANTGTGAEDSSAARGIYIDDEDETLLWMLSSGGTDADPNIAFHGALTAWRRNLGDLNVAPVKIGQYRGFGSNHSVITAMSGPRSAAFVRNGGRRFAAVPAESPNNITVIDVTDPTNLVKVGAVKDTTKLNGPMDIAIGVDGHALVACLAASGSVGRGVSKWDLHIL